jgi:hypothetical protein
MDSLYMYTSYARGTGAYMRSLQQRGNNYSVLLVAAANRATTCCCLRAGRLKNSAPDNDMINVTTNDNTSMNTKNSIIYCNVVDVGYIIGMRYRLSVSVIIGFIYSTDIKY